MLLLGPKIVCNQHACDGHTWPTALYVHMYVRVSNECLFSRSPWMFMVGEVNWHLSICFVDEINFKSIVFTSRHEIRVCLFDCLVPLALRRATAAMYMAHTHFMS